MLGWLLWSRDSTDLTAPGSTFLLEQGPAPGEPPTPAMLALCSSHRVPLIIITGPPMILRQDSDKINFTKLGNPEMCMSITVNFPKALAGELLRACRAVHPWQSLGQAPSGTSALSQTLPTHCGLSWPSVSKAVALEPPELLPSLSCPIILQLRFLFCFHRIKYHSCV